MGFSWSGTMEKQSTRECIEFPRFCDIKAHALLSYGWKVKEIFFEKIFKRRDLIYYGTKLYSAQCTYMGRNEALKV